MYLAISICFFLGGGGGGWGWESDRRYLSPCCLIYLRTLLRLAKC